MLKVGKKLHCELLTLMLGKCLSLFELLKHELNYSKPGLTTMTWFSLFFLFWINSVIQNKKNKKVF